MATSRDLAKLCTPTGRASHLSSACEQGIFTPPSRTPSRCASARLMHQFTDPAPPTFTAAALAHVNRSPVLFLPGDVFATRPIQYCSRSRILRTARYANDCFGRCPAISIESARPGQILALPRAMATLLDPRPQRSLWPYARTCRPRPSIATFFASAFGPFGRSLLTHAKWTSWFLAGGRTVPVADPGAASCTAEPRRRRVFAATPPTSRSLETRRQRRAAVESPCNRRHRRDGIERGQRGGGGLRSDSGYRTARISRQDRRSRSARRAAGSRRSMSPLTIGQTWGGSWLGTRVDEFAPMLRAGRRSTMHGMPVAPGRRRRLLPRNLCPRTRRSSVPCGAAQT